MVLNLLIKCCSCTWDFLYILTKFWTAVFCSQVGQTSPRRRDWILQERSFWDESLGLFKVISLDCFQVSEKQIQVNGFAVRLALFGVFNPDWLEYVSELLLWTAEKLWDIREFTQADVHVLPMFCCTLLSSNNLHARFLPAQELWMDKNCAENLALHELRFGQEAVSKKQRNWPHHGMAENLQESIRRNGAPKSPQTVWCGCGSKLR